MINWHSNIVFSPKMGTLVFPYLCQPNRPFVWICGQVSQFQIGRQETVFKHLQPSSGSVSRRCHSWAGDWRGAGAAMCRMCPECCAVLSLSSVDRVGSPCHKPARTARAFTNYKTLNSHIIATNKKDHKNRRVSAKDHFSKCIFERGLEPIFTKFSDLNLSKEKT